MRDLKGKLRRAKKRARRKKREAARAQTTAHTTTAGARLTFRAELMPGRSAMERTFTVARVLAGGRVELSGLGGQHTLTEFEAAG
jgi:hypothetical protein